MSDRLPPMLSKPTQTVNDTSLRAGAIPLCVDLDGTLIHSDLLIESALALIKRSVLYVFILPIWLLSGKARLKHNIAQEMLLKPCSLPYQNELLIYLHQQKAAGRPLVLATAANIAYARQIAEHLELFEEIVASDEHNNLSGSCKLQRLQTLYGQNGFDYVADAAVDLNIWRHARRAVVVNAHPRLVDRVRKVAEIEKIFEPPQPGLKDYARALRLHQWLKNTLVFVPLMTAHWIAQIDSIASAFLGFLAFSLCASGVYLLNDLLDLEADRQHHRKRNRPLPSGLIPLWHGILLAPLLLVAAALLSLLISLPFAAALGAYFILTLAYSLKLKRIAMLDVTVLALLYTSRVIAGVAAIGGEYSFWLLGFSLFIFFSLALVKRCAELEFILERGQNEASGRAYRATDLPLLYAFGAASGCVAVLVLALYINSSDVHLLYSHPQGLWLMCPAILYWVSRIWFITHRGLMHDDPVVFAATDRISLALGAFIIAVTGLSI